MNILLLKMKRSSNSITAISEIQKLYNVKNCNTIDQILENIHFSDKEQERICINLMIDRYSYDKSFIINKDNFIKCREEVKKFLT